MEEKKIKKKEIYTIQVSRSDWTGSLFLFFFFFWIQIRYDDIWAGWVRSLTQSMCSPGIRRCFILSEAELYIVIGI